MSYKPKLVCLTNRFIMSDILFYEHDSRFYTRRGVGKKKEELKQLKVGGSDLGRQNSVGVGFPQDLEKVVDTYRGP